MAQETINVGTFDNDPSADTARGAFTKCNDNFDELYAASSSGVALATIAFYSNTGEVVNITDGGTFPLPFADTGVYIAPFNPTNYRLTYVCYGSTGTTDCGFSFDWSTDGVSWTPSGAYVSGVVTDVGFVVTDAGTLSIPGSPSVVYIRPTSVNNSIDISVNISVRLMTLTLWTGAISSAPVITSLVWFNADDSLYYVQTMVGPGGQTTVDQTGTPTPP